VTNGVSVAHTRQIAETVDASVVIPTKNRSLDLGRCLRALSKQQTARRFEVIVVDDGSSPPIRQEDLETFSSARVISSGGVGPAAARNRGLHAATAPVILFTDDDTAPSPRWVDSACAFLKIHPDHIGVEGPTVSPRFDALYERSVQNHRPGAYWTCNVAYRRAALDELDGFAEVFPSPHCEDLDLGLRALHLGPIGFVADMSVTHYPTSVTVKDIVRRTRYLSSEIVLHRRHPDRFSSKLPVRLRPPLGMLRYFTRTLWRERQAMIKRPRRFARFLVVAAGQLAVSALTSLQPIDSDANEGGR
jgi:glycosyltransferase involved in cell wall biosynthesis